MSGVKAGQWNCKMEQDVIATLHSKQPKNGDRLDLLKFMV